MKIKVLIPNSGMDRDTLKARESMLSRAVSSGTHISVDCIPGGPISIESVTDEVMAGPYLMEAGRQAQREGYDAFVSCFSSPQAPYRSFPPKTAKTHSFRCVSSSHRTRFAGLRREPCFPPLTAQPA